MQHRFGWGFILVTAVLMIACNGGRQTEMSRAALDQQQENPTRNGQTIANADELDLARYVEPRIGSFPPGFTSPGAARPQGLVAAGPDTEGPLAYGGYSVNNALITGFSHIHMSAGVFQGGQIPVMPILGSTGFADLSDLGYPNPVPQYASPFNKVTEVAEAGYYAVQLPLYGVDVAITATQRAALHHYQWSLPGARGIVLEPSRDTKGHHPAILTLREDGVILGKMLSSSPEHTVYFALRSETPYTLEHADGSAIAINSLQQSENLTVVLRPVNQADSTQIKVALSYVDELGALNNLDTEMPGWDFAALRQTARSAWNQELARIQVTGANDSRLRSFYTALYRTLKFPNLLSDVDGRYRIEDEVRQDANRPRYTQFSLWDSYRGHSALLAEIIPQRYEDMVMSLVEYAEITGHLPRWQLANRNPGYMSGDPAVMYVGEAWCRGLLDDEQRERAWQALLATVTERDEEINLGYKPSGQPSDPFDAITGGSREAGTTLEYGLADFSLATMAANRGDREVEKQRLQYALNYRNLLDAETGWIRPKDNTGAWIAPFQPEYGFGFQEGTSWQYSWLVMHDYATLLDSMNAVESAEQRLDQFFGFPLNMLPLLWPTAQNTITFFGTTYYGNQYAPGNEHDLEAPYVYNYLGQPWKSQIASRSAAAIYTDNPLGLPGNDDLGALSGWLVWTMLGIYPINPGLPHFLVGSPEFESARIIRPNGDLRISRGPDGFVNAAQLNGTELNAPSFIMPRNAADLNLLTDVLPDSTFSTLPPSISTHEIAAFGCGHQTQNVANP
ncbi:MAG: GH92 family glycosyl hydrolase [Oceanococcus sp.]